MSSQPGPSSALIAADDNTGRAGGFLPAVAEKLGTYVYLLVDPRDRQVFHVGTGTGDRCFRDPDRAPGDHAQATLARIREIEAAVIEAMGSTDLRERVAGDATRGVGRMSVGEINQRYGATPVTIQPEHPVVLISIPPAFRRAGDRQLYEMARGWWKVGARRERAQWALAVSDGVVRAVYRIRGWEPARAGNRWGFRGHRDPEMEREYVHRDVSSYLDGDAYYTLTYVNC